MDKQDLKRIFKSSKGKNVLVIGDFCLDAYWVADMQKSNMSLETPRYPRPVVEERYSSGAAGNVSWNFVDFGLDVYGVGLLGDDWRGGILKTSLEENGISTDYLGTTSTRVTPAYFKPIIKSKESSQEDARLDFDNYRKPEEKNLKRLIRDMKQLLPRVEAVVLEDQLEYGLLSNEVFRNSLNEISASTETPFVVDSRNRITDYSDMVLKPNKSEAGQVLQEDVETDDWGEKQLKKAARKLYQNSESPIFITADQEGVFIYDCLEEEKFERIPTIDISEPYDVTGAGDTFMCGLVSSLIGGATSKEAGLVGNIAASISIKTIGETGTATPQEILENFEKFDWNF